MNFHFASCPTMVMLLLPGYVLAIVAYCLALRALRQSRKIATEAQASYGAQTAGADSPASDQSSENTEVDSATQHFYNGNTHLLAERHSEARAEFEAGLVDVQKTDNALLCAQILGNLGHSYLSTADFARSVGVLKCSYAKALDCPDNTELLAWLDQNLVYCAQQLAAAKSNEKLEAINGLISAGELDQAAELAGDALEALAAKQGEASWLSAALKSRLAYVLLQQGRHYEALVLLQQAQDEIEPFAGEQPGEVSSITANLTYCHNWLGF